MKFDNTSAAPSGGFTFGGGHSSHFSATSSNVKKSTNHNGFGSTTNGFSFGTTSSNVKPSTSTSSYQGDYQGESPCSYTPDGVTPGKCTFSFTPFTPSGKFKSAIQKLDSVGNKTKNNAPLAFGSTPSLESGKSSFTTNMFSIVGKKSDNDFKLKYQQPWYCQTCGTMNNFDVYTCSNTSCSSKNILKKKQLQVISKIQSRFRFRKKFGLMNAAMKRKTFQDWHSFSKKSKSRNKICKQLKKESQTSSKPLFVTMLNMLKEKASVNLVNTDIERYCFLDILLEEMVKRKDNMLNARCVILDDVPPIKEVTEFLYLLLICEKIHVNLRSQSFLLILKWLTCHDFNHKNILQNIVAYFGISGSSTFIQFYTKNGTDTTAKKNENKTKPFVRHEIKSSGGFQFDPNLSFNNNIFNIAKEDQAEYLKGVFKKDTKGDPKQKKHASKLGKGKNIFASLGIKTKKDLEAEKKNITNASSASRACKEKNIFASLEIKTKKEITNNVLNDKSHVAAVSSDIKCNIMIVMIHIMQEYGNSDGRDNLYDLSDDMKLFVRDFLIHIYLGSVQRTKTELEFIEVDKVTNNNEKKQYLYAELSEDKKNVIFMTTKGLSNDNVVIEYRLKARRKSTAVGWARFPIVTYDSVKKCFKSATWAKGTFGTDSEIRLKINDIVVDTTDEKEALKKSRDAKTEKLNEMMQKQIKHGSETMLEKMRKNNLIKKPSTTSSKGGVFGGSTTSSNGGMFGGSSTQRTNASTGGLFGGSSTQRTNASTGGLFSRPTTTSSKGGLFGGASTQRTNGGGLFGGASTTSSKPASKGSFYVSSIKGDKQFMSISSMASCQNKSQEEIRLGDYVDMNSGGYSGTTTGKGFFNEAVALFQSKKTSLKTNDKTEALALYAIKLYLKALQAVSDTVDGKGFNHERIAPILILLIGDSEKKKFDEFNEYEKVYGAIPFLRRFFRRKQLEKPKKLKCVLKKFMPDIMKLRNDKDKTLSVENVKELWNLVATFASKHIRDVKKYFQEEKKFEIELKKKLRTILQKRVPKMRKKSKESIETKQKQLAAKYADSIPVQSIVSELGLSSEMANKIGKLKAEQEALVGLDAVKKHILKTIADVEGRFKVLEKVTLRHIIISGNAGSGKNTSAKLIADWCDVLTVQIKPRKANSITFGNMSANVSAIKVGSRVTLKTDYKKFDTEADGGPLNPGQIGVVTRVEGRSPQYSATSPPYNPTGRGGGGGFGGGNSSGNGGNGYITIKYNKTDWSYREGALEIVKPKKYKEIASLDALKEELQNVDKPLKEPISIYWPMIESEPICRKKLVAISTCLSAACDKNIRVIIGASVSISNTISALTCFRKYKPDLISLPVISPANLARISLNKLRERGYKLQCDDECNSDFLTMKKIVKSKYKAKEIYDRNAWLANDCVDQAITRKNKRLKDSGGDDNFAMHSPLVLTIGDFDVNTVSREEKEKKRQAINEKIAAQIGWGSNDENSPRWWFQRVREHIEEHERSENNVKKTDTDTKYCLKNVFDDDERKVDSGGNDGNAISIAKTSTNCDSNDSQPTLASWEFNTIIEGNDGVGKTLFMELATEFLHAYNILPSNTFIKSSAPNLYNAAAENRNDTFASICKNVEGGIMVSQAELILPTNAVNESNYVTSAKTGLVESLVQEASKPSSFIALACKPNKAISIKNSHAEIETKFPWHVRIPNPSPETLVKIAEQYVQQRNSALQEGLQDKLAQHLHDTCGKVPEGGVRFIRNLVDQAIRSRVERISKDETQLNTNNILIPADFGIGKELGDPELIAEVMKEVEGLIGMDSAKQWLKKISKSIKFVNITGDRRSVKRCYNLKLTGCPGTGKTTFARIIHKFFKAHGILTGEFVEKNALELKGEYVGSTAPLVKAAFKDAKFGTLFIDEAYALASENGKGGDTFSKEAIRTMLTEIENNRDNTLVIIAGYQDKIERLLREDPGLPRRFPEALHLVNYSTNEIAQIAEYVAFSRNGKSFEPGLVEALSKHIGIKYRRKIASENGGLAVNLVQKAVQALEGRLLESSEGQTRNPTELMNDAKTICGIDFGIEDLGKGSIGADQLKKDEIAAKVENLIGMANMKEFFAKMKNTALYVEKTGNTAPLFNSMNLVLMGNPGTGKSTTARLIGEFLFAHGILETGHFKEINALHLKGQYVGQTAHNVREIVQDALGGCLFIDEAYALISNGGDTFGKEVIQTLLTEIENHRSELLVILAGYEGPMGKLLMADPGLKRRFRQQVILKNYNGTELAEIAEAKAEEKDYIFAPGLKEKLAKWIPFKWSEEMASHNGGLAVNLVETAMENLAERTMKNWDKLNLNIEDKMTQVYVKTFLAQDFGINENELENIHPDDHDNYNNSNNIINTIQPRNVFDIIGMSMNNLNQEKYNRFANGPSPSGAPRYRPNRYKEGRGGGGDDDDQQRIRNAPTIEITEVKEEEEEEEEKEEEEDMVEMSDKLLKEKMDKIGICPQSYKWLPGRGTCMNCQQQFINGYRCAGGSHYVCKKCVNKA